MPSETLLRDSKRCRRRRRLLRRLMREAEEGGWEMQCSLSKTSATMARRLRELDGRLEADSQMRDTLLAGGQA
jgi:hypothetical protein